MEFFVGNVYKNRVQINLVYSKLLTNLLSLIALTLCCFIFAKGKLPEAKITKGGGCRFSDGWGFP